MEGMEALKNRRGIFLESALGEIPINGNIAPVNQYPIVRLYIAVLRM